MVDSGARRTFIQLPSTAPRSLHLIILLADTPIPSVKEHHGTYHDIFSTLFRNSIKSIEHAIHNSSHLDLNPPHHDDRYSLTVESWDTVQGEFPSEERIKEVDAVLITGSAASAYSGLPWITALTTFVSKLPSVNPSLKIFGICFGHQIIAQAFGSKVEKNSQGWEVGVRRVELTELGTSVFGWERENRAEGGKATAPLLTIHQMHSDHVPTLPPNFELLGSTPVCYNQGMLKRDSSKFSHKEGSGGFDLESIAIITVQGHPEFTPDIVGKIIDAREKSGVLSHEFADQSRVHAKENDEGIKIGEVFLGILGVRP
ncbi:class I glutamine amidotransferase-like protein [Meredithblackwellia eburnea MCA 4105]